MDGERFERSLSFDTPRKLCISKVYYSLCEEDEKLGYNKKLIRSIDDKRKVFIDFTSEGITIDKRETASRDRNSRARKRTRRCMRAYYYRVTSSDVSAFSGRHLDSDVNCLRRKSVLDARRHRRHHRFSLLPSPSRACSLSLFPFRLLPIILFPQPRRTRANSLLIELTRHGLLDTLTV